MCEGLPLSLKLLGALVYQKDLDYCETQLREISKILRTGIEGTLKICYDSLDEQEKDTFLDIACFFINEDRDMAITIWDASGWEGKLNLENLQNNCLVEIDSKNCIRMNDFLRDLGRNLAGKERFPYLRFILYHFEENIVKNKISYSIRQALDQPLNYACRLRFSCCG